MTTTPEPKDPTTPESSPQPPPAPAYPASSSETTYPAAGETTAYPASSSAPPSPPAQPGTAGTLSPSEERTWGLVAHLAPFAGGIVGLPFLGALVVYLMYKDRSAFVKRHAMESLNFQLTLLIGYIISFVLIFVVIGFLTLAAIAIASIIFQIIGAIAANKGEEYRYPVAIRFIS